MNFQTKRRMKQMGVLACTLLLAGAMTGCGKEDKVTAESIMKTASENAEKAKSIKGNMDMDMTIGMKASGMTMSLDAGVTMDLETLTEPSMYHMKGTMKVNLMDLSMDMETYGEESEDGQTITTYTYTNGAWSKNESDKEEDAASKLLDWETLTGEAKLTLEDATEKVNGQDAYVLKTTINGAELVKSSGAVSDLLGEDKQDIDVSKTSVDVKINVYKESMLPAALEMDMKDGFSIANDDGGTDVTMSVDAMKLVINFTEYDSINTIEIPAEAKGSQSAGEDASGEDLLGSILGNEVSGEKETKRALGIKESEETSEAEDASETEDPQDALHTDGQGNAIITDYDHQKQFVVKTPEGMTLSEYSDAYSAMYNYEFDADSFGYVSAYYAVNAAYGTTAEEMAEYIMEDSQRYEEDEDYTDVVIEEAKTVKAGDMDVLYTAVSYTYNGDLYVKEYQAWTVTEDDYIIMCYASENTNDAPGTYLSEERIIEMMSGISEK